MNNVISVAKKSARDLEATEDSADLLAVFAWPITWAPFEVGHETLQSCVGYPGSTLDINLLFLTRPLDGRALDFHTLEFLDLLHW